MSTVGQAKMSVVATFAFVREREKWLCSALIIFVATITMERTAKGIEATNEGLISDHVL